LPCLPRDQVVRAVATQRERFELAGPMKARARECCDLVLVSLYVFIPLSRGLEIRTLEVLADGELLTAQSISLSFLLYDQSRCHRKSS